MLRFQAFRISESAIRGLWFFPKNPLGSHQFKFNLPRWLFVGRFEDKWCCRSMVFTSGILRVFQELERNQQEKQTVGQDNVRQQHAGVEQFEDVFFRSMLLQDKPDLFDRCLGMLECFQKRSTVHWKTEWQKTKPIFISITFVCQVSTCILCLDYMIMILLACEENNQLCFKGHSLISSDFAGFWHFSDFHPVARVSKRMMNYDDLFRCGETRPMHEVVQAANADVAKAFNGLRTLGGGWGMVGSNGSW